MAELTKIGVAVAVGGALGAAAVSALQTQAPNAVKSVAEPLLKLYVYDHCPFCVRARMIFGLKNIKHELLFVANHDEVTPISLVGAKMVPILQLPSGKAFPESMDIVRYVDNHYGGPAVLADSAEREDIKQWIRDTAETFRLLYHPRFHAAVFPEFAMRESREYYRIKKEKALGMTFHQALAKTPELVEEANEQLEKLSELFHSNRSVNATLSYDDIDLFGRLRGLTLVKDLKWPKKLREYMDHMSQVSDVLLLDSMARH